MNNNDKDIIDVEIVDEGNDTSNGQSQHTRTYQSCGRRCGTTFFTMTQFQSPGHQGMMPASTVTLILFFICLFQWGFLAALGFIFFYAMGAILGSVYTMRQVMQGRVPNPWFWRLGNWFVSMAIVSCLI